MRPFAVLSTQSSILDGHVIADDGVEVLPHVVIAWLARLHTADLICGPRHDVIPPRLGHPMLRPLSLSTGWGIVPRGESIRRKSGSRSSCCGGIHVVSCL